jgi:hypothetical protein
MRCAIAGEIQCNSCHGGFKCQLLGEKWLSVHVGTKTRNTKYIGTDKMHFRSTNARYTHSAYQVGFPGVLGGR